MMFAGWLRPDRALITAAVVAVGVLACRDTTTPKQVSNAGVAFEPLSTAADGFVGTPNGRGNLGTFNIKSKGAGYTVELKSRDNTDIVVTDIVVKPGGHSGWHMHPGPVLVVVKSGTITFYHGSRSKDDGEGDDDLSCSPMVHRAGTAFTEQAGQVGIARNEGTVPAVVVATFFVPKGAATRIDAHKPANCPF